MCPSDEDRFVLDSCVVIDFCGRSDNLVHLLSHIDGQGVVTTAVHDELVYNQRKRFSRLSTFLDLVARGQVELIDPDITNETARRILSKWSASFGAGEVSSAALAASRSWVFVSQDLEPMRMLRLSETLRMETTADVLASLVRRKSISSHQAARIQQQIRDASRRGRK